MQNKIKVMSFNKNSTFTVEDFSINFYKSKAAYFSRFRKARIVGIWDLKRKIFANTWKKIKAKQYKNAVVFYICENLFCSVTFCKLKIQKNVKNKCKIKY